MAFNLKWRPRLGFKRLTSWLGFLFALMVLAPLALFGLLAYQLAQSSLEDDLGQRLAIVAALAARELSSTPVAALTEGGQVYRDLDRRLRGIVETSQVGGLVLLDRDQKVLLDTTQSYRFGEVFLPVNLDLAEWQRALKGEAVSAPLFTGRDGALYKSAYAPVLDRSKRLTAMVRSEASAAYLSILRRFSYLFLAFGAASVILAWILAAWVSRPIVRPVQGLIRAAGAAAKGDFSQRVEVKRADEIGMLANTFNEMAQQLGEYVRSRERLATLGELSAGVAHEIRNPLGAIEGFAELLVQKLPKDDARGGYAADILKEVRTLNQFLGDFLEFARPNPLRLESLDLAQTVQSAMQVAFPRGLRGRWRVERSGLDRLGARGDAEQLRRVMVNLLLNAKDSMPQGGTVRLGLQRQDGQAVAWVEDEGRGISEADLAQVFKPFFTTKPMGTGLGLSIAEKIVSGCNGKITARSQAGKGSRFTVYLPLAGRESI